MSHRRLAVLAALAAAALAWPAAVHAQNANPDELHLAWWRVVPDSPCPGDSLFLRVDWCTDCARLIRAEWDVEGGLVIEVEKTSSDSCLPDECYPTSNTLVPLGSHQAGNFVLAGTLIEHFPGANDPRITQFRVEYTVPRDCDPDSLQFVRRVLIRGPNQRPICENDSIHVTLLGELPDDCHVIRRVDLVYPVYFRAGPPFVRVLVDTRACLGRPCTTQPQPWRADLVLPPLPAFDIPYSLAVQEFVVTCADTFPDEPDATGRFPFVVHPAEACRLAPCLLSKWSGPKSPGCTSTIGPAGPTSVILKIASGVPLAGFQGELRFDHPGLRIIGLDPVGAAASWSLTWQRNSTGVSFVMFSPDGSLLPAVAPVPSDTLGEPLLRVTVEQIANAIEPVTRLHLFRPLGADSAGRGVEPCMVITLEYLDLNARFCADRPCDANNDRVSDVRDLVLMVQCLTNPDCPDSSRFDCDRDGDFTLGDILCCAMAILKRPAEGDPGAPRPEADVGVTFGRPVTEGGVITVPVQVRGADALGGALLRLRYPSSRYRLVGVEKENWPAFLPLSHDQGDDLAIGFVNMTWVATRASEAMMPGTVTFRVRLEPRPGAEAGGALELVDGQFSSPQGDRLAVDLEASGMPIVPPTRATLSAARPNPFARETRFSVDLPRAAPVEITVHDLSGRRVTELFRGELPAGRRDFTWNGTLSRGGRAADGVYFVRLAADGQVVSSKVVMLRQP